MGKRDDQRLVLRPECSERPPRAWPRGRALPAWFRRERIPARGGADPGGFLRFPLADGEGGARVIRSRHRSEPGGAAGGARARPPKGVAPLTPRPQVRRSRPKRSQAGARRDPTGRNRGTRRSRRLRLCNLNRGGRAARPRFAAAIGCGGAVTSARGGRGRSPGGECPSGSQPRAREPEANRCRADMGRQPRRLAEPTERNAQLRRLGALVSGDPGRRRVLPPPRLWPRQPPGALRGLGGLGVGTSIPPPPPRGRRGLKRAL